MEDEKKQVQICYVLLCHKQPNFVIEQIEYLVESGAKVVYHMDANTPKAWRAEIANKFKSNESVTTVASIKAGWGDWSLSSAALRMLNRAMEAFPEATHFYHLSGDCLPIRTAAEMELTLADLNADIIETAEFYHSGWIKTGPHLNRIKLYHFFNERKHKWWFYRSYDVQKFLGINRKVPDDLRMSIGSQWWCLRRETIRRILKFIANRPDVVRFFKRVWIPDETFFQTVVASLVSEDEIISKPPTFLRFSDYGFPAVFYEDHYDFLVQQDRFFARKISGNAVRLRKRLVRNFLSTPDHLEKVHLSSSSRDEGIETMNFLIHAGRNGNRFGSRMWEKYNRVDGDRRVYLIISKKWHVGHRVGSALSEITGVPYAGYVFDEHGFDINGLGNLENGIQKRRIKPAAFLRSLMEAKRLNEIIIGIDTSRFDVMKELNESSSDFRVMEIENEFDDDYLQGHAQRMGIIGAKGVSMQKNSLNISLLETLKSESSRLKEINFSNFEKIREWHSAKLRADIFGNIFERETSDFLNMARHVEIKD